MKIEAVTDGTKLSGILNGFYQEGNKNCGLDIQSKPFGYVVRDDNNKIFGGISGWRVFDEIYIDEICLDKSIRGQGFGRKLLEIVESEVNDGGCENISLFTTDFQSAVGFYEKCGFEVAFVREHKNNKKFSKYHMVKNLKD